MTTYTDTNYHRWADLINIAYARDAVTDGRAVTLRVAAGVSQATLAAQLGVDTTLFVTWEVGTATPPRHYTARYGQILRGYAGWPDAETALATFRSFQ